MNEVRRGLMAVVGMSVPDARPNGGRIHGRVGHAAEEHGERVREGRYGFGWLHRNRLRGDWRRPFAVVRSRLSSGGGADAAIRRGR